MIAAVSHFVKVLGLPVGTCRRRILQLVRMGWGPVDLRKKVVAVVERNQLIFLDQIM